MKKKLSGLQDGKYEDIYANFIGGGTPYYITALSIAKTFAEQMGGAIGASYQNEELTIWLSFAKQRL